MGLATLAAPSVHGADYIWIEAAAAQTNCNGKQAGEDSNATGVASDGTWAFHPPRDEFAPDSLLDLRWLNERVAGERGFVRRSADGSDFVLGDGRPARFWAVNDSAFDKDLARHARFLAKRGINLVRFHCNITPTGNDLLAIDPADRDRLWKGSRGDERKEGIYVTYSPYWAGASHTKPAHGIP